MKTTEFLKQIGLSSETIVSVSSSYTRRKEITLWLIDNPWVDIRDTGSITFHFKGDSLIPKFELVDPPRKLTPS